MTIKELVEKYWKDFEIIAFETVKNKLSSNYIISEKLTQAIKDGGYDGEFILLSQNDSVFQILFEAKLRSTTSLDLPIKDFAKALIIAIVRQADMIYIVTNLNFSQKTIRILETYANNVSLEIELLNGYSVKNFVQKNEESLKHINSDLKKFLLSQENIQCEQSISRKLFNVINLTENEKNQIITKYSKQINALTNMRNILIVKGNVGSGKSYFIEKFCCLLKTYTKYVYIIDLSKCLTYKELFLEILKKAFGITLDLIDLIDEQSFDEVFSKIGISNASEDDIQMLKFIFSKNVEFKYDYSILFAMMVDFYERIYQIAETKRHIIVAFQNIAYAQKEVLQFLLYMLKSKYIFSNILEISSDAFWSKDNNYWDAFKTNIIHLSSIPTITINDWDINNAKKFLKEHISELTDKQAYDLIHKFGKMPGELSNLVELINYSKISETTPKELIFQEIMKLSLNKNDCLYMKCLEFLQYTNSDTLYIFAFLYFIGGEIQLHLLLTFFHENANRLNKVLSIIKSSNLFIVDGQKISIKNSKIEECLQIFCQERLYSYLVIPIATFIKDNKQNLHLTSEKKLELKCKLKYYENTKECIISLIELGDKYLNLGHLELSKTKYQQGLQLLDDNPDINLSSIHRIKLHLGIVETTIWKIGSDYDEIEQHLNLVSNLISSTNASSNQYQLLSLRYYRLLYQFYHTQSKDVLALNAAKKGVNWVIKHNLYDKNLEECGKIWRFYAIANKENKDMQTCLDIFNQGLCKCSDSVKFLFGYVIHQNMIISEKNPQKRLEKKLNNYKLLSNKSKKLSIDEYLHYKTNVAALHFLQKKYELAWNEYQELLEKSTIFNITREQVRILNDMANICWINDDIEEARKKYYTGKKQGEISGCTRNLWPLLVNLVSFEIYCKNYIDAFKIHLNLKQHLENICSKLAANNLGIENTEYYTAALMIHLKNLLVLNDNMQNKQIINDINELLTKSMLYKETQINENEKIINIIKGFKLNSTIFEHNGLFLIKD